MTWRAFCVASDVAFFLWVLFGASGCAVTPAMVREYTPAAAEFVRDACVDLRARVSSDYDAGKLDGAAALARMERVNAVCDHAADGLDTVDDLLQLAEEAKLWDSAK